MESARLWDVRTGEELLKLEGHGAGNVGGFHTGVLNAVFSPDGQTVATAGADGTARIWNAGTGEELRVLEGHTAGLTNVAFSPDGKLLATGSDEPDVSVKIWDLSGLDQAAPGAPLPIVLILPEGDTPAISAKGEILIGTAELLRGFTLEDERLLEIAASRVTRGLTAEECARFNTEECAEDD